MPKIDEEKELWSTVDDAVLQWIYATISHDMLHTILEPDATATEAWNRLRDIFQDNKNSWAVTLEHEFSCTNMEDFPNASTYCQWLKELSDQLKNIGAPMLNNCLVLQMMVGLTKAYNGVVTLIRQSDLLPPFYQGYSMITLEKVGLAKKVATGGGSVMVARDTDDSHSFSKNFHQNQNTHGDKKGQNHNNSGKNNDGNCGGVKSNDGDDCSGSHNSG